MFGEYTVLLKGEALAIPLHGMAGHWMVTDGIDRDLLSWARYLHTLSVSGHLPWPMEVNEFLRYVESGGSFRSDIPRGCGMGSSGALVAAFTESYSTGLPSDPQQIKKGLSVLESHFHGQSSGLDPLVSLTRSPIHVTGSGEVRQVSLPRLPRGFFLVDTGLARHTAPLVQAFRTKLEQASERSILLLDLLPQVQRAVEALLEDDRIPLEEALTAISRIQARVFREMIPEHLVPCWEGRDHHLKLCGAGGGGYFLGYTTGGTWPDLPYPVIPLSDLV